MRDFPAGLLEVCVAWRYLRGHFVTCEGVPPSPRSGVVAPEQLHIEIIKFYYP